ncbi:hypothetical protein OKHIF_44320 [Mycobacteroides chelonae]
MVASLGPYALINRRSGAHASTSSRGQSSPAVTTVRTAANRVRSSDDNTVGVNTAAVTCCACKNSVNASAA